MSNDVEFRYLGEVQRLTLNPGDVVVISTDERITQELAEAIRKKASLKFPGHEVLVLSAGLRIGVVGAASDTTKEATPA